MKLHILHASDVTVVYIVKYKLHELRLHFTQTVKLFSVMYTWG